jgi:AraC family transcriptional regulator
VGWRWKGRKDSLHVYLPPELISRVASEAFDLDSNRLPTPSLDCLDAPQLLTAMLAVENELLAQGMGGPLAAESLANMLAVYLIRHLLAPARLPSGPYGILPPKRFRAVVEYIMENLESKLTLEQLAAVTHLSPYHFARLFKATTGLAPHQYVIVRRVERAKHLLQQKGADLSMVEVALRVGFSDQSQFTHHFKRIVGATPGQFRNSARIA